MKFVSAMLFTVLVALALLHAYWGFGGRWPASNDRDLARTVVGVARLPSAAACYGVAVALALAGFYAIWTGRILRPPWPFELTLAGSLGLALLFLLRGLGGYHPAWRRSHPLEPFAIYDKRFYSPLCLAFGFAYLILSLWAIMT
jgi:hypothetical protein